MQRVGLAGTLDVFVLFSMGCGWSTAGEVEGAAPPPREVEASSRGGETLARDPDAATKLALLPLTPSERAAQSSRRGALRGTKSVDVPRGGVVRSADQLAPPATVAEAPAEAEHSETGLDFRILRAGTGEQPPALDDEVEVHYSAWTTDGRLFDSSYLRGSPEVVRVRYTTPAWREALLTMVTGEMRRLWVPARLAYGIGERAGGPPGMVVFDIELLEVRRGP